MHNNVWTAEDSFEILPTTEKNSCLNFAAARNMNKQDRRGNDAVREGGVLMKFSSPSLELSKFG